MTITLRAVGTTTAAAGAVTGVTAGVPAGLTVTDLSILTVEIKGSTAGTAPTITTPAGWTLIGTVTNNGTLVAGIDTGSNTVGMYYRVGTYTAPTITTTGADSMGAGIVGYATSIPGGSWDVSSTTTGSDTTSGANASITGAANISVATGDWVITGVGVSGDVGTISAETLTATGATIGTRANRINLGVTTGNDSRLLVSDWPATAGTSTAAPVYTYTNTSSTTSHARFLRIREVREPLPYTETWTGTNGAAWPAEWTSATGGIDIQANAGRMVTGATDYSTMRAYLAGTEQIADVDVLVTFTLSSLAESYLGVTIRDPDGTAASGPAAATGMLCQITPSATNTFVEFYRDVAGVKTWLAFISGISLAASTAYKLRFRAVGTVLQAKLWAASGSEPGAWSLEYTDASAVTAAGSVMLGYQNGAGTGALTVTFDDLTVGAPPTSVDYTQSPADVAAASDAVTVLRNEVNFPADTAGAVDSVAVAQGWNTFPADTAGAVDSAAVSLGESAFPGDFAAAADAAAVSQNQNVSPGDTAGAVDAVTATLAHGQILATETWSGTNGAAWPAQWTTAVSGGSVTQNGAGQGVLTSAAAAGGYGDNAYLSGLTPVRDMDLTFDVSFPSITQRFFVVGIRSNNSVSATSAPTNMYYIQIDPSRTAGSSMEFGKFVAGTQTRIAQFTFGPAWVANTAQTIRFQAVGNQMQVKWWAAGTAEPGTWGLTPAADTSLSAATGSVWMAMYTAAATAMTVNVDNMVLTDGGGSVPWTAAPADDAAASDSVSVAQGENTFPGDVAAAADTVTLAQSLTATDVAAGVDAVVSALSTTASAADVAGAVDSASAVQTISVTAADVAAGIDAASVVRGVSSAAADTAGVVDAVTIVLSAAITAADVAGAVDAAAVVQTKAITVADAAGAVDAAAAVADLTRAPADTAGAVDAASRIAATARGPADAAAATDSVTVNLVRGDLTLGVTWVQFDNPDTPTKQAVTEATVEVQNVHVNAFGSDLGYNATTGDTNWAGYNWTWLDTRVQLMRDAKGPGGKLAITLYAPPQWMLGVAPNTWDFFAIPLPPARNADWASLCAYIAQRYPDVGYFQVWNEMKGYWNNTLNRWDYEGFTAMYNAVYNAVKAVRPDAQIGGPYLSFNVHTTGYGGASSTSTAAMDLGGTASSITGTGGPGYFFDGRDLDVYNYFRLNSAGVDFVCVDLGLLLDDAAVHPETADRFAKLPQWVNARFPNKPIWFSEYYYGGGTTNFELVRAQMDSTNLPVTALLWHAITGEADLLFDSSGVRTPVGDAHAAFLANKVGQPVLADTAGATDSVTAVMTVSRTAVDVAGAADAVATALADNVTVTDTAGATDAAAQVVSATRLAADTAGAVDAGSGQLTLGAIDYTQTPADVAGASDAVSAVAAVARPLTDVAGATDSVSAVGGYAPTVADAAGAVDAVTAVASSFVTVTDSAGVVDGSSLAGTESVADAAAATDAVAVTQAAQVTVTDTAAAVDAVSVNASGSLSATAADTAAGVDAVSATATSTRTVADTTGAVDAVATAVGVQGAAADVAGAVDAVSVSLSGGLFPADVAGAVDAVSWTASATATLADAAAVVDTATPLQALARGAADTAGVVDAANAGLTLLLQGSAADFAGATDAVAASVSRDSSPADIAGASDAVTYTMVRVVFVDDTAGVSDTVAPQRNSSWLLADSAAAVDAAQGVLANAGLMTVSYRLRYGEVTGGLRSGSFTGRLLD